MVALPATVAAEQVITRQNVALSSIKQSNDQQQAVAEIVANAIESAPVSQSVGTNVDIKV